MHTGAIKDQMPSLSQNKIYWICPGHGVNCWILFTMSKFLGDKVWNIWYMFNVYVLYVIDLKNID